MSDLYTHARMGAVFLNSGSGATAGVFKAFYTIEETSLTAITFENPSQTSPIVPGQNLIYAGADVLANATLPAGLYVPVPFNSVTIASGTIMALGVAN